MANSVDFPQPLCDNPPCAIVLPPKLGLTNMNVLNKIKILSSFGPGLGFLIGRTAWATMDLRVFGSENLDQAYRKHGQIICAF